MADSSITKKALSSAFKSLLNNKPFAKISVGDICEECEMNRKSFYYHFRDKYDLVNWIFDCEFLALVREKGLGTGRELLDEFCAYFYEHQMFYKKILTVEGQNSFSDYLKEFICSIIANDAEDALDEKTLDFFANFYADAFVCSIKHWLGENESMRPSEFSSLLKSCIIGVFDDTLSKKKGIEEAYT